MRSRLRARPEVRDALERMWPVLSGVELVNDLFGFRALVRSAANGVLNADEQGLLHRRREVDVHDAAWTEADIPIVDEADSLLGPVESARPRKKRRRPSEDALRSAGAVIEDLGLQGYADAATIAARFGEPANDGGGGDGGEPRIFGHVLVDEAQDLTAMQWRMLARRCPSGSMTVVGDPGQASRPGAVVSWDDVLSHAAVAQSAPIRHAVGQLPHTGRGHGRRDAAAGGRGADRRAVHLGAAHRRASPLRHVDHRDAVGRRGRARPRGVRPNTGTIAVIAPSALHAALVDALADLGAVADSAEALDAPIAVLDAASAKGLEFDHVVVVEPAELVRPDRAGLRLLYVTITRTTKTLTIVHAEPLPEGLAPTASASDPTGVQIPGLES